MRAAIILAVVVCFATPAMAQNPFKIKTASRSVSVTYTMTGSMTGTAEYAATKEKFVRHSKSTGKFFGKTTTTESWSLYTPETIYTADLAEKTGQQTPNMFPVMAREYDKLSGAEKERFGQNMKDMSQLFAQAFGAGGFAGEDKGTTATYAGETCVEHTFGSFSSCMLKDAPQIPLHESGSMFCVDFEQTATAVTWGDPPAGTFDLPAGITFKEDSAVTAQSDSMARTMVRYFASQELSDSLAAAKARAHEQHASASSTSAPESGPQMSKEDCEKLRDLNLGTMLANSFNSVVKEAVNEAVQEKEAEMKNNAKNKIKGIIKKPKLF
ncbi:MAG TPA: hypothetical protein VFO96_07155 [Gemmatimonadales bacterium]|jgi:hypothetical protein|nr:hypothetical protein [Gemmatimonadales bacterium]